MKESKTFTTYYPHHHRVSSSMSAIGFEETHKTTKKVAHGHHDSGELDVFEAASYFSAIQDAAYAGATASLMSMREEKPAWGGGRKSLDMPLQQNPHLSHSHRQEKHTKEKKSKQPSSPGGKLASFLNSLFSQTSSKKKKSKSITAQSIRDEEESPSCRRKRRSSISHFHNISATDAQSKHSSSSSGLRTPPPKVYRDMPMSRCNLQPRSASMYRSNGAFDEKDFGFDRFDERFRFDDAFLEKDREGVDKKSSKGRIYKKGGGQVDDGWESDSSSDLFELQNYDLGVYSGGLPVYETTHVGSTKMGGPIATVTH